MNPGKSIYIRKQELKPAGFGKNGRVADRPASWMMDFNQRQNLVEVGHICTA
jgi:hypothetical protein